MFVINCKKLTSINMDWTWHAHTVPIFDTHVSREVWIEVLSLSGVSDMAVQKKIDKFL